MKTFSTLRNGILLVAALVVVAGCEKGPAEKAGEKLDKAGQKVKDAVDPPNGPAEKAGRAIDRTVNP